MDTEYKLAAVRGWDGQTLLHGCGYYLYCAVEGCLRTRERQLYSTANISMPLSYSLYDDQCCST